VRLEELGTFKNSLNRVSNPRLSGLWHIYIYIYIISVSKIFTAYNPIYTLYYILSFQLSELSVKLLVGH
jgi:hypothetical protein